MKKIDNLCVLIGPTAIGKTSISLELADLINAEIISADSMQIYKYMDIGSAKIKEHEMEGIPHHLIDIIYPDEEYTVADYKNQAKKLIRDINRRGKIPLVVGGTGLYVNSLVYDLDFTRVKASEEIRNRLQALGDKYGNEYLHSKLTKIDSISANKINIEDRRRIIRAIEIYEVTGRKMSEQNMNFRKETNDYNISMIGLNTDRKKLYERINYRVDKMVGEGLIDEVNMLLEMGYDKNLPSMQGIGYKEVIMYLEGIISLDEAVNIIKKGTRNYAKRQLTWFKRDNRIKWIYTDDFDNANELLISIARQIEIL
ncbi:MAG: tRNA (adenosine(37)-N6)-dimethylallyltransferase MiaA [Tissierellaceae bacterium]|nr:tRNA (adenosine(37)-N6)-dimethylallyltransferase MiaA [Tissierellaceae bacterium]